MTWLLAVDPGPTESAWLEIRDDVPVAFAKEPNHDVLARVRDAMAPRLAIEMIAGYGMPVGVEVFETAVWSGRLMQTWYDLAPGSCQPGSHDTVLRLYRKDIKRHLCGTTTAKDPNVRQALIDRFGPGRDRAIGLKKSPGPLYGVKADVWSALAVAVTAADQLARCEVVVEAL